MTIEHERLTGLLTGLQQLARGDAEALPERSPVDLGVLAAEAVHDARRRHPSVDFLWRPRDTDAAASAGWPNGLRTALDNLLDNAALHGRQDGTVDVTLVTDDGRVEVTVSDDGPGIPPQDRERLKLRFARGNDSNSPGSGLGLALVDQQARLHGGTLTLGEGPAGGLQATLVLPRHDERHR